MQNKNKFLKPKPNFLIKEKNRIQIFICDLLFNLGQNPKTLLN